MSSRVFVMPAGCQTLRRMVGVGVARAHVASRQEFSTHAANAPSRGAWYLAKRDGLAAWGCRRESQLEHRALSRRVAGEAEPRYPVTRQARSLEVG
jgi:hypothetical protein